MGEGIRSSKEAALDVDDLQIEVCEVEQPLCLVMIEILCLTEVCQVLIVCEDLDGEGGSVEVVPPGLQSMDDGEELLVIDVIVLLSQDK